MLDEYFARAGEVFGHLQSQMGFGRLSMSIEGQAFRYSLEVKISGDTYEKSGYVDFSRLAKETDLEILARNLVDSWKRDIRKMETPPGQYFREFKS